MNKAKCLLLAVAAAAMGFTFLTGCSDRVVELDRLQQRGGVYVMPETQKPYSGKFVVTDENTVRKAGTLKKGKLHGEFTTYHSDGSIDKVETFADDVLNGKSEDYYGNGKIKQAGNYKNGEKDGKWEDYDENGKLRRLEHYKDGKEDGKREHYDENEKLRRVEHYKDGKEDGKREYYDENGKLWFVGHYKDENIVAQQGSFTDPRDNKAYKTVKIVTQTWMAENLNYEADGSKCYDNNPANCQKYGRLYDWETAMKACPSGWRLPSGDEWQKLVDLAGGDNIAAGTVLKAKSGWNRNRNGRDEFSFSALPGGNGYSALPDGYGGSDGNFYGVGNHCLWWSSSENNSDGAYDRGVYYGIDYSLFGGSVLLSVRCVKD